MRHILALTTALCLETLGAAAAPPPAVTFVVDQDYQPQKQTPEQIAADFSLVRALGIGTLRTGIGWDDTNPHPETFRWGFWSRVVSLAADDGIAIRPYYAYTPGWAGPSYNSPPYHDGDFARACGVMADMIGDAVPSLEVWNEPDNTAFWTGSAGRFGNTLSACTASIRAASPRTQLVLGGLVYLDTAWLDRTNIRAPDAYDIAAFHQYTETPWDHTRVEQVDAPRNFAPAYDRLSEHGRVPVWMNEGGATTDASLGYSEQTQANWIRRTVASLLDQPGRPLSLIGFYQLRDPDPKLGHPIGDPVARRFFMHTGLFHVDGRPKLAAATVADIVHLFGERHVEPISDIRYRVDTGATSPLFRLHVWRLDSGLRVVMLWDRSATSCGSLELPAWIEAAYLHDADGTITRMRGPDGGRLQLPCLVAGGMPLLMEMRG